MDQIYDGPSWLPSGNPGSYYKTANTTVNNGLHLALKRENYQGFSYTSGGIGGLADKYRIAEGRWEAQAKFPQGDQGLPAYILLWSTGSGEPPIAEIDFGETTGSKANYIILTQHWSSGGQYLDIGNSTTIDLTQFHIYAVDILGGQIKYYIDGNLIATQPQKFPKGTTFGVSAGIEAGDCSGGWGGCPKNTALPQYLDVNYIKIYDSIPTPVTKKFNVYNIGDANNPSGILTLKNVGGTYTADEACGQVCNILKTIT